MLGGSKKGADKSRQGRSIAESRSSAFPFPRRRRAATGPGSFKLYEGRISQLQCIHAKTTCSHSPCPPYDFTGTASACIAMRQPAPPRPRPIRGCAHLSCPRMRREPVAPDPISGTVHRTVDQGGDGEDAADDGAGRRCKVRERLASFPMDDLHRRDFVC